MTTTYFLDLVSRQIFGKYSTPVIPSIYYIGVSSTTPTIGGTGVTEPTGGAYARIQVENNSTNITQNGTGTGTNVYALSFAESTANWGTMTNYVVYDGLTNGNLLMYGALDRTRTVESGTTLQIKAGQLQLSFVNP